MTRGFLEIDHTYLSHCSAVGFISSSVKSTQLAVPALVSRHVAILVPVDVDLCRKREWDLTHDIFPLKSVHCEGLSVYHRWCEADSDIVQGSADPESDGSLIDSLTDDKDNRSIVSDGAVHVGFISATGFLILVL